MQVLLIDEPEIISKNALDAGSMVLTFTCATRFIKTKLQVTTSVSIALENVWTCQVQVTYDEATSRMANRRCSRLSINSYNAQSSRTKLRVNISTRKVPNTTIGWTILYPNPSHRDLRISIGVP